MALHLIWSLRFDLRKIQSRPLRFSFQDYLFLRSIFNCSESVLASGELSTSALSLISSFTWLSSLSSHIIVPLPRVMAGARVSLVLLVRNWLHMRLFKGPVIYCLGYMFSYFQCQSYGSCKCHSRNVLQFFLYLPQVWCKFSTFSAIFRKNEIKTISVPLWQAE